MARQLTSEEKRESDAAKEQGEGAGAVASLAIFFSNLLGLGGEGGSEHEADFQAGRTIVRVKASKRTQEAMEILLPVLGRTDRVTIWLT